MRWVVAVSSWNRHYKRIRMILELDKRDVTEIMRLGGASESLSEIEGWQRQADDSRRYRTMSAAQFNAFTLGLVEWTRD